MPMIQPDAPHLWEPVLGVSANEQAEAETMQPNMGQIAGAAIRQGNMIGSLAGAQDANLSMERQPGFKIWDKIKGSKYEGQWESFADISNDHDLVKRQTQIDMEEHDRKTLAQSGWTGTLASVIAGTLDPSILVPVVGGVAKARTIANVGRAALETGLSVGAGSAVQEAGLQASQQTLTPQESAIAIGSSILLGGFLGGAAGLLAPAERATATAAIDRLRAPQGAPLGKAGDAGSAATETATREGLTVEGKVAGALLDATDWISPNTRMNTSPATSIRMFGQQLTEGTMYQGLHGEGGSLGPAVETLMRTEMNGKLYSARAAHDAIFSDGAKAGFGMNRAEFEDAIGRAMRRNDEGDNAFVSQAAKAWRDQVFEPFKKMAIEEKLLPADVSVDTADSYFRRMWNVNRLNAEEGRFKQVGVDYFNGTLAKEYKDDVTRLQGRIGKLEQEKADLALPAAQRTQTLKDLEGDQRQLYFENPEHVDRADQLAELRQQLIDARRAKNPVDAKAAQEAAAKLKAEGGKSFDAFLKKRAELNNRMRNVGLNYAGIAEKRDVIANSLADLAEATRRSMERLVKKGQAFERERQRLDPDKVAAKVSDLREAFAAEATKAERQAEKFKAQADKLKERQKETGQSQGAESAALLEAQAKAEAARAEHLTAIADRLETAESLDPQAAIDEIRNGVDSLIAEASNTALARGEKAQRLQERMAKLDPKKVDDRLKSIEQMRKDYERGHYDKWEIQRGAEIGVRDPTSGRKVLQPEAGTFDLLHGRDSAEDFTGFEPKFTGERYEDRGGTFGADGVYLDNNGDWQKPGQYGFGVKRSYRVQLTAKKMLTVSPETISLLHKEIGGNLHPKDILAYAKAHGYDAINVHGFQKVVNDIRNDPRSVAPGPDDIIQDSRRIPWDRLTDEEKSYIEKRVRSEERNSPHDEIMAEYKRDGATTHDLEEKYYKDNNVNDYTAQDQVFAFNPENIKKTGDYTHGEPYKPPKFGSGLKEVFDDLPPDFSQYSKDIMDAVYDKLTGRGFDNNMPDNLVPVTRGPLKERTFHIPDLHVEDFLHDNIMHVAHDYARKMASEIELTRRFGSADMKGPLAKVQEEYKGLRSALENAASIDEIRAITGKDPGMLSGILEKMKEPTTESVKAKALNYLTKREKNDTEDLQAMRDLLRGTYKKANMNNIWGRTARGLLSFNYITRMGGVLLANVSEVFRPAMVFGMKSYMSEGVAPLFTEAGRAAAGMAVHEARLAGQVVEKVLRHRIASYAEMGDPYAHGSAIERLLDQGTRVASRWNGLTLWTDGMKAVSSILSQNRIIDALKTGKDDRMLAFLGMDASMRSRVSEMLQHAEKKEGVWIANTENWTDAGAVRAYRAAMSKDVDSVIVTRSVGDVPLFANTPTGKLITQFKSFALASHQRVLIKGMQENPTRFMSGMVGMTAMGMLATYLRAVSTNRVDKLTQDNNPGWWIGEGVDSTGILSIPMEFANTIEKATTVNPLKDPLRAAGAAATGGSMGPGTLRYQSRGKFGALLGPTVGMGDDLFTILGALTAHATGRDVKPGQDKAGIDAAARMTPFYSYPILRQIIDYGVKPGLHQAVGAN